MFVHRPHHYLNKICELEPKSLFLCGNRQAKAYLYLRPIITPHEVEFPFTIQTGTIHPSEAWNK